LHGQCGIGWTSGAISLGTAAGRAARSVRRCLSPGLFVFRRRRHVVSAASTVLSIGSGSPAALASMESLRGHGKTAGCRKSVLNRQGRAGCRKFADATVQP